MGGAAPLPAEWTSSDLRRMAESYSHSIQLTAPRASLLPAQELLSDIYSDFVDERMRVGSAVRGRSEAKYEMSRAVRELLTSRLIDAGSVRALLHRKSVAGRAEPQRFDLIVGNGTPVFVSHALSFEADAALPSEQALRALAFRIEDVRKLQPKLTFGVYALPPVESADSDKSHQRLSIARTLLESVDAQVVTEDQFSSWASPLVDAAVAHAA